MLFFFSGDDHTVLSQKVKHLKNKVNIWFFFFFLSSLSFSLSLFLLLSFSFFLSFPLSPSFSFIFLDFLIFCSRIFCHWILRVLDGEGSEMRFFFFFWERREREERKKEKEVFFLELTQYYLSLFFLSLSFSLFFLFFREKNKSKVVLEEDLTPLSLSSIFDLLSSTTWTFNSEFLHFFFLTYCLFTDWESVVVGLVSRWSKDAANSILMVFFWFFLIFFWFFLIFFLICFWFLDLGFDFVLELFCSLSLSLFLFFSNKRIR